MLVVEPEKRYTLKQISQHRWMQCRSPSINEDCCNTTPMATSEIVTETPANLDSIVVNHMLQLPNLTFDEIAESVHQNTFNHIYAIYNLLVDKLQAKRNEQQRLQHHASLGYTKYGFFSHLSCVVMHCIFSKFNIIFILRVFCSFLFL